MKKTFLSPFVIPDISQLLPLDFNTLLIKVIHAKGKEKNFYNDTLLLATLSKGLAPGEYSPFINTPPSTAPFPDDAAPATEKYKLELQIKDQSKAFNKATSKYNRLEEKGKNLRKEKIDIEGKIQKNEYQLQFRIIEVAAKRHQLAESYNERERTRNREPL